eukprot:m.273960 g.273960  ORF g.273960 m.273960 type:complete len:1381 (+) comp15684_c1_seq66:129-4271(+)
MFRRCTCGALMLAVALAIAFATERARAEETGCASPNQCSVLYDPFCTTNTSSLWVENQATKVPRDFGNGPSCTAAASYYHASTTYNVTGSTTNALFMKGSVVFTNFSTLFVVGYRQADTVDMVASFHASSAFWYVPGVACQLVSTQGLLQRKPDNLNPDLPIKLALQTIGNKTLHWAIYNNDTEFMHAKSDYALDPELPSAILPGYVNAPGQNPAKSCIEGYSIDSSLCNPQCDAISRASLCIERTECMWFNETCVAYTSCPFNLASAPSLCFDGTCDFFNPGGVGSACCNAITTHCNQNHDDFGCDCDMLGFRCPELACNTTTFVTPPELCAATTYPVIQRTKRCAPGLTSMELEVLASDVTDAMCSVLVEERSGLRCISEPCLYPPSAVAGNIITCKLSESVLSNELTLHVYALEAHPVTPETTAQCGEKLETLSLATRGYYSAQCESCDLGRVRVLDVKPMCNLAPGETITVFTTLTPLEDPISCHFWRRAADGVTWESPVDWETPITSSTLETVVCKTPSTFTVGIESHVTVSVEGYYTNCARPPPPDPTGTLVLSVADLGLLPVTCHMCDFEAETSIATGLPVPSPCDSNACSNIEASETYSAPCCDNIFDFCEDAACTCQEVATAGCSVASTCTPHPESSLSGTCNRGDVVVQIIAHEETLLATTNQLSNEQFFELVQQRISVLGIPKTHVTCVYTAFSHLYAVVPVFIHFSNADSARVFEEALRSQSYSLFEDFNPTSEPPTPGPPITVGAQIAIALTLVIVLVIVAVGAQRRRAKRAASTRAQSADDAAAIEGADRGDVPSTKVAKQHLYPVAASFNTVNSRLEEPSSMLVNRSALMQFYASSFQNGLCDALSASTMHVAAALGDMEMVETITRSAVLGGQQAIGVTDINGQTPLMWACKHAHNRAIVRSLVQYGSAVNQQDCGGRTALHHACSCGNDLAVSVLLEAGADPLVLDAQGDVAAHHALQSRRANELLRLLTKFMQLSDVRDCFGRSLLTQSILDGNSVTRRLLLELCSEHQYWLNSKDRQGWTALHWGARLDDAEAVDDLLVAGADVNVVDAQGNTALHLAAEESSMTVALMLAPITVQTPNLAGDTPTSLIQNHTMLTQPMARHARESVQSGTSLSSSTAGQNLPSGFTSLRQHPTAFNHFPDETDGQPAYLPDLGDIGMLLDDVASNASVSGSQRLPSTLPPLPPVGDALFVLNALDIVSPASTHDTAVASSLTGTSDTDVGSAVLGTTDTTATAAATPTTTLKNSRQESGVDTGSTVDEYEIVLDLLKQNTSKKRSKTRTTPRPSCWKGSDAQRERNKEACRLRRERLRAERAAIQVQVDRQKELYAVVEGVLATLKLDRARLASLLVSPALDTLDETSFV